MRLTSALFAALLALGVAQAGRSWFGDGLGLSRDDTFSGTDDFFSGMIDWDLGIIGPSFLRGVKRQGRRDYKKIMKNKTLTRAQIEKAVTNWAQKYNVTEEVNAHNANKQSEKAQFRSNVTSAVQELPKLISQLNAIEDNQNLTPKQASQQTREAIRNATQPFLSDVIMDFVPPPSAMGDILGEWVNGDAFKRK